MASTTIKVPIALRDRLAEMARAEHTTLAGAIERSLAAADEARFWTDLATTMGASATPPKVDAERDSAVLTDGLDPNEDWTDIW